jgi:hypothetical protein
MTTSLRFICLLALLAASAAAQSLPIVRTITENGSPGDPIAWDIGDIDGDGLDDVAITSPGSGLQGSSPGVIAGGYFVSSVTGAQFSVSALSLIAPGSFIRYPRRFFRAGDVDGDGIADIAAFIPREGGPFGSTPGQATLRFHKGLDGSFIGEILFPPLGTDFAFEAAGDRNGDGREDYLLAYAKAVTPFLNETVISVVDGATLSETNLVVFNGFEYEPSGFALLGDMNGDGVSEFASGTRLYSDPLPNVGSSTVFDGASGAILSNLSGQTANAFLGWRIDELGDLNGDGISEFATLERGFASGGAIVGRVRVVDPMTNTVLFDISPPAGERILDFRMTQDLDGDGQREILLDLDLLNFGAARREIRRLADGAILPALQAREIPVGDLNGDGIADLIDMPPVQARGIPRTFVARALLGGQRYGAGVGGRQLDWLPDLNGPATGTLSFTGAQPAAPLLGAVSLQATNEIIFGTNFPLWVSAAPQHLVLSVNEIAEVDGSFSTFVDLVQPALAGLVFYVQYAELGANPGTSNAVELLFGL